MGSGPCNLDRRQPHVETNNPEAVHWLPGGATCFRFSRRPVDLGQGTREKLSFLATDPANSAKRKRGSSPDTRWARARLLGEVYTWQELEWNGDAQAGS